MLKGNIIPYAALVRVVPFPLAQTSMEKSILFFSPNPEASGRDVALGIL